MKYYQQYGVLQMISQDILDCSKNKTRCRSTTYQY